MTLMRYDPMGFWGDGIGIGAGLCGAGIFLGGAFERKA